MNGEKRKTNGTKKRFPVRNAALLVLGMAIVVVAAFFLLPKRAAEQPVQNTTSVAESSEAFVLAKDMHPGWNLGNSLEIADTVHGFLPYPEYMEEVETFHGNPVTTKEMIHAVAERGFKSIRIPVTWFHHLEGSRAENEGGTRRERAGEKIDPAFLSRVKEVVDWALAEDFYVIINAHYDTSMQPTRWIYADAEVYEESRADLVRLWTQIAEAFRDYDHRLIFQGLGEILNLEGKDSPLAFAKESEADFRTAHDLNQAFIDAVRKTGGNNADRFLLLSPYAASADPYMIEQMFYKPFEDSAENRLLFSVHSYETEETVIREGFAAVEKLSKQYGMPYILDEYGTQILRHEENGGVFENPEGTAPAERVRVTRLYNELAVQYETTAMIWDDGAKAYGLYDRTKNSFTGRDEEAQQIIDAIFPATE